LQIFKIIANGVNLKILFQKADMAIGDLSINFEREEAVDFTMPWMNTGNRTSFVIEYSTNSP